MGNYRKISALCIWISLCVQNKAQVADESLARRYLDLYTSKPNVLNATSFDPYVQERNLTIISERCPRNAFFSSFDPQHADAVDILTKYFMEQPGEEALETFAKSCKENGNIHPKVWFEALTRARRVIPTPNFPFFPNPVEFFPTSFFPAVLEKNTTKEKCVKLNESFGEDNGIENKLWYFREDVLLNAHHWIWHLLFPFNSTENIDRRGEQFYYFHHELLARYTAEGISNGLKLQSTLNVLHEDAILEEGYNTHLTNGIANLSYVDRRPFTHIYDSIPNSVRGLFKDVSTERDRIVDAVNQGGVLHDNGFLELKRFDRINILGDISEASLVSINRNYYGMRGYHNQGHNFIAMIDAPEGPNQPRGAMTSSETAARDVIFYRWHKWIDVFFQSYKLTHLKPYELRTGDYPLVFEGIHINYVKIIPESFHGETVAINHLETFWNEREFHLGTSLDFIDKRSLNVCAKHLDHQEFTYHMNIENSLDRTVLATVRIFMAPRYDLNGQRYSMLEQRSLFFTLDVFQTTLQPGIQPLYRKSIDSTVTAGWPKSFKDIEDGINMGGNTVSECACGFAHHLLLPKGNSKGVVFDLFVMITNGLEDRVSNPRNSTAHFFGDTTCTPSQVFCGLQGRKYPDSKPMGYPFDRKPYSVKKGAVYTTGEKREVKRPVDNLEEYVYYVPNMHSSQVIIQHHNEFRL